MAIDLPLKMKSYLCPKLGRKRRPSSSSSYPAPECDNQKKQYPVTMVEELAPEVFEEQPESSFFQKLPIEIRKMIYSYVWQGPYDHKYHMPTGRHIHFKDGHWTNTRCVMFKVDEDLDFIQKNMDMIHSSGHGDLLMWQKRLASTWGSRHWRCEERLEYGKKSSIDHTDFASLMLVCKRMYPEAMESIFESHTFLFNHLFSAHRFFVTHPSPFISKIRSLDLTLNLPFHEYSPFFLEGPPKNVKEMMHSLGQITCLHNLRLSFDVCDRGPWRKLPERDITTHLGDVMVLKDFTIELPPPLPIRTHPIRMEDIDGQELLPYKTVLRRPPLRYWQFNPGEVDRFTWETYRKGSQHHCWIALNKDAKFIVNPYLIDLCGR